MQSAEHWLRPQGTDDSVLDRVPLSTSTRTLPQLQRSPSIRRRPSKGSTPITKKSNDQSRLLKTLPVIEDQEDSQFPTRSRSTRIGRSHPAAHDALPETSSKLQKSDSITISSVPTEATLEVLLQDLNLGSTNDGAITLTEPDQSRKGLERHHSSRSTLDQQTALKWSRSNDQPHRTSKHLAQDFETSSSTASVVVISLPGEDVTATREDSFNKSFDNTETSIALSDELATGTEATIETNQLTADLPDVRIASMDAIVHQTLLGGVSEAVQRSVSTPLATGLISKFKHKIRGCPTRWVSASHVQDNTKELPAQPERPPCALNGVSIFYSSKSNELYMPYGSEGLVQLTNSQKIRRCFSFQARIGILRTQSARSVDILRSYTTKHRQTILKSIPFSQLMRSKSLETASFLHSVKQLEAIRAALGEAARSKHWFRAGKISASGRSAVMRVAYPTLKCSLCPRVFKGIERKHRYARHCKKMHESSHCAADVDDTESLHSSNEIFSPARGGAIQSVDEYLLDHSIITGVSVSTLPHQTTPDNENAPSSVCDSSTSLDDFSDGPHRVYPASPSPRKSSPPETPSPSTIPVPMSSATTGDVLWSESYVPWRQDRITKSVLAPIEEAEEPSRPLPPSARCSQCNITYHGTNAMVFLTRHINAIHKIPLSITTTGRSSAPTSLPEFRCPHCDAEFPGIYGKQFLEQHVVQAHLNNSTYRGPGLESSQAEPVQILSPYREPWEFEYLQEHPAELLGPSILHPNLREQSESNSSHMGSLNMYPTMKCNVCEKEFTGRYGKGNLARHVRTEHPLSISLHGQECRVCKQGYTRADARRKHEWKKHRMLDAKPSKRRSET
jgi:hypothetical protein